MLSEPAVIDRPAQPYAGMAAKIEQPADFRTAADRLPRSIRAWLAAHNTAPAGPPFVRVNFADGKGRFEIEWGVPTDAPVATDGEIIAGTLPAGRYAGLTLTGGYEGLGEAHTTLRRWTAEHGYQADAAQGPDGERPACLYEAYVTDPSAEPDPAKWRTDLAIRLA
jgi:effector-binding domain-containing protein